MNQHSHYIYLIKVYKIMRLEHESEKEIKDKVLKIISEKLDLDQYEVFLFGSRITGEGDERSDIDIAIEGDDKIPIDILGDIKEEVEKLPTLYTIDVVDLNRTSKHFREVAKQKTETVK